MARRADKQAEVIEALRIRIGRIGSGASIRPGMGARVRFGLDAIDRRLPGGGLPAGALHEVLGQGPDTEHGTLASLLIGGLLAGLDPTRQVLWAMQGRDLFPPGLAGVGLHPERLILAECGGSVLAVMEEALRHPGLVAVVGEIDGGFGLTASRRLQLAAEASGVTAFAIRRSRRFDDPALLAPSAAVSRWRISVEPTLSVADQMAASLTASLAASLAGRALWRLELLRCREATPFHWIVQACDANGRLGDTTPSGSVQAPYRRSLADALADRPAARFG